MVVPGDQDRHSLRGVGVADAPVHPAPTRERGERGAELSLLEPEAFALDLQRIKNSPLSLTYWSDERMLPSCIAMNPETAAMRPLLSGQEMKSFTS